MLRAGAEQGEDLPSGAFVNVVLDAHDNLRSILQNIVRLVSLVFCLLSLCFRFDSSIFRDLTLFSGLQGLRDRPRSEDQRQNKNDVSKSRRPFTLFLLLLRLLHSGFRFTQRLFAIRLRGSHGCELLALGAYPRVRLLFARADEVELEGRGVGRGFGPARRPRFGLPDIVAEQQPVRRPPGLVPLERALEIAGMLPKPVEIGMERPDQLLEAGAEARSRHRRLVIEEDIVQGLKPRRRPRVAKRKADDRKNTLAEPRRFLALPIADGRNGRCRRKHENDRIGLGDQVAKAGLPVLAAGNVLAVDEAVESASLAAIGDEYAKPARVGRVGPLRLPWRGRVPHWLVWIPLLRNDIRHQHCSDRSDTIG